jgi:hypothetical protein
MELFNKMNIWIIFLIICLFSSSCSDNKDEILKIIYKDSVVNINSIMSAKLEDNNIVLKYTITNEEKQNIYFPIAFFHIQSSIGGGSILMTSPDNTFDNTYIQNTVHIYPRNTSITSLSHMNGGQILKNMPYFLKIKPLKSITLIISFPNEFVNSNTKRTRLIDTTLYLAHLKIALIKEEKFKNILKLISLDRQLKSFIMKNDTLEVISKKMDMGINESLKLSKVKISEYQSKVINELCNVKIDFLCDIENQNSK